MRDMISAVTNKMLNEMVETAIRQAVQLQVKANKEDAKQRELRDSNKPYDFRMKHQMLEGSHAVCEVLWRVYGGYPYQMHKAIEILVDENKSKSLGLDCQDYIALFEDALKKVS